MKLRNLFITLGLSLTVGAAVAVGISSSKNDVEIKQADAAGTNITVYCKISTSDLGSYSLGGWAKVSNETTYDLVMTEVENGITTSGYKVFKSQAFQEEYGGINSLGFKVMDGSTQKSYSQVIGTWTTALSSYNNKVFTYTTESSTLTGSAYTIPSRYSFIGSESSWATDRDLSGSGTSYTITRSVARGETFKFRRNHCWYESVGYDSNKVSGTGASFFAASGTDFKCVLDGNYTFTVNPSTSAVAITDNTSVTTYSYVLTAWDNYSCAHLYDDGGSYAAWESAPAVSSLGGGQAYNIKVAYNSVDYYGLYRINDRYITSFDNLIMKKSGNVSGTYENQSDTFTLSGGSKIYISSNNGTPTSLASNSDLYKAVDVMYEIAIRRGNASYGGHDFDFSICAISKSDATTISNNYDALTSAAKTICKNSTLYVYDLSGEYSENNKVYKSFEDIVNSVKLIANRSSGIGSNSLFNLGSESGAGAATIIVVIAAMSILTVAAYSFFKKGKSANKQ